MLRTYLWLPSSHTHVIFLDFCTPILTLFSFSGFSFCLHGMYTSCIGSPSNAPLIYKIVRCTIKKIGIQFLSVAINRLIGLIIKKYLSFNYIVCIINYQHSSLIFHNYICITKSQVEQSDIATNSSFSSLYVYFSFYKIVHRDLVDG